MTAGKTGPQALFDDFNRNAARHGSAARMESPQALKSSRVREAFDAWKSVKGNRPLPTRAEMTPRVMKKFLTQVAVLDVVREGSHTRYRGRITGTALEKVFGGKPGEFLDEAFPEPYRSRWTSMMDLAVQAQGPVRVTGLVEYGSREYLKIESLYAPLGCDIAEPEAILIVSQIDTAA